VGPAVVEACELPQLARGSGHRCAAAARVVGLAHAPLSGHRTKRVSERERDGERAGDADATVHDKLKRSSWDRYKMDKI
jgi:hypothetical protein